jgi:crotonobetainyl-CoA:carnitine CoA-transferase CaiB-like acyl-CoA transferase
MAPELGQHTETILMEMGRDWDEIEALKAAGVIN